MLSRFKFEIEGLFQEMYEKLPEYVFTREGITFADLQAAGLQSIVPIVNKLRENGRSDEYIRSHVFAFCEDELDLSSVQFEFSDLPVTLDIYRESIDMKFDVIVGNPPYQESGRIDQANKLWPKMVLKGFDLLRENGCMVMITPNGWMNSKTADIGKGKSGVRIYKDIFKKNNLLYVNADSEEIRTKYFNGVGSTFSVFVVQKSVYGGSTKFYNNGENININITDINDLPKNINKNTISILSKFNEYKVKFNFTDQNHNLNGDESPIFNEETHPYSLFHTHKNGGTYWYGEKESKHYGKHNIVITLSGKYEAVYTQSSFSNMCVGVSFETENESTNVLSFLNSKLYKFAVEMNKFSGFNPRQFVLSLPKIDTTRVWTDNEVMDFFNLTSEEKKYINEYGL